MMVMSGSAEQPVYLEYLLSILLLFHQGFFKNVLSEGILGAHVGELKKAEKCHTSFHESVI